MNKSTIFSLGRGKERERKKKIWFYFIQQKVLELTAIPIITFLPFLAGDKLGDFLNIDLNILAKWVYGFFAIIVAIIILMVIGGLIFLFLRSNWNLAVHRVDKEIK